jgi:integrating conjugative element protein (TIGR03755 family)
MKKLLLILILMPSVMFADNNYSNFVPNMENSPLYYKMGGGDIVPQAPSMTNDLSFGFDGLGAVGYSCGTGNFNLGSSIMNSLNGIKNTGMNMFNDVVNSAEGAIIEMPAYIIAKSNPSLYELMQKGLASGQWDIDTGLKSCQQMQGDIDDGKNPYSGMFSASKHASWKFMQHKGSFSATKSTRSLSYQDAANSGVASAKSVVDADDGKSGVPWVKGANYNGSRHAGGAGQPAIMLTNDMVVAGTNALLSRKDYASNSTIPSTENLSYYFNTPTDASKWATAVVGESTIYTVPTQTSSSIAGKGLLPKVQTEYQDVYKNLGFMISGETAINVKNLKKVSTQRLMINADIIHQFQNDTPMNRAMEVSALAQGIASTKVINKAQQIIMILQAAKNVPNIAINSTAQQAINDDIAHIKEQINLIVNNNDINKKLIINTITAIENNKASYIAKGNAVVSQDNTNKPLINGVIKE